MARILFKRFIKYCCENVFLFVALLVLVTAAVSVVLAIESTAYTVLDGRSEFKDYENIEDGQFVTMFELSDEEIEELSNKYDVNIQKNYSIDVKTKGITYRLFSDRNEIDRLTLNEGDKPKSDSEIVIEQIAALKQNLHIGDEIKIKEKIYKISGIGSIPEYTHPTKTRTDAGIVPEKFTWVILNEDGFEAFRNDNLSEPVEYTYAYIAGDTDIVEFSKDIKNCLDFVQKEDNRRMNVEIKYARLYRTVGYFIGIVLVAMLAFIFAIVTKNQIHNEHLEIGSLYALGVSKLTIMIFYIIPTLLITLIAGILGSVIGFAPGLVNVAVAAFHRTNSFPYYELARPSILYLYAIVMPPVMSFIVDFICLDKTLSSSSVSLMRGNYEKQKASKIKPKHENFIRGFQLNRLVSDKSSKMVFLGIIVSIMLFMLGINTHYLAINNYKVTESGTNYDYMCTLKYPVDDLETSGEKILIKEAKAQKYGINISFSIMGIDEKSKFYDFDLDTEEGEAVVGEALSTKLGLKKGDELIFTEGLDRTEHRVKIVDVVKSNASLELYMNKKHALKEFEEDSDYYNAVLFKGKPDINKDYIYSTLETDEVLDSFRVMEDTMLPFMCLAYISSIIIFISTMFLIVSTMIDRSKSGISLIKIMGFDDWEIQRMYINPMIYAVLMALIVAMPVAKIACDLICPRVYSDLPMGMFFKLPWFSYLLMVIGATSIFLIILLLLVKKVKRISTNEILKNRE